ncbi:MAG TPA: hypothetical protein VI455_02840 [Terriglobia bacterium]
MTVVDWSPDGQYLSFDAFNATEGHEENWILPLTGDKKPFQVVHTDAGVYDGNFSPDGRWFAYFSYESGRPEVYVIPFPGPGGKYQISHTGGWAVRWARDGKLFYSTIGNRLMEADIALSANSLQVKSIRPLFEMNPPNIAMPLFDVTPDGQKFVVVTSDRPESSLITLVTNWTAALKPLNPWPSAGIVTSWSAPGSVAVSARAEHEVGSWRPLQRTIMAFRRRCPYVALRRGN